jgi:hypothetical protein
MQNSVTSNSSYSLKSKTLSAFISSSIFFLLTLGLTSLSPGAAKAESAATAPAQLKTTLAQIDAAASSRQLPQVMQFYSPNFTNSDGLNRQGMQKALTELWQRYPQMQYRTQIQSWQADGNNIVAETITYITGVQQKNGRNIKLDAILQARQRFQNNKILRQDILAERTQLASGSKPPTVDVVLPKQVRSGQEYNFDAIVKEPLGDNLLLGAAVEEPVRTDGYLKPGAYELQPLNAGGIFKVGKAPAKAGNYWVSAVLIRADGITMVTQRLQVVKGS